MKTDDSKRSLFLALLFLTIIAVPFFTMAGDVVYISPKNESGDRLVAGLLPEPQRCFANEKIIKAEAGYISGNILDDYDYFDYVDKNNIKDFIETQKYAVPEIKCL